MDENRIAAAAKELGGKVRGKAGELIGYCPTQGEGDALKGAVQNLYGQAKDAVDDAAGMAGAMVERGGIDGDRVTGTAKELRGRIQSAVADVTGGDRDRVEGRRRRIEGRVQDLYGQAKDAARDVGTRAGKRHGPYAGKNPLLGLLIAGATGYGLALLIHGRR